MPPYVKKSHCLIIGSKLTMSVQMHNLLRGRYSNDHPSEGRCDQHICSYPFKSRIRRQYIGRAKRLDSRSCTKTSNLDFPSIQVGMERSERLFHVPHSLWNGRALFARSVGFPGRRCGSRSKCKCLNGLRDVEKSAKRHTSSQNLDKE